MGSGFGLEDCGAGAHARYRGFIEERPSAGDVLDRHRTSGGGDRGLGEVQVHVGDLCQLTQVRQLTNRGGAGGHRLIDASCEGEHLHPPAAHCGTFRSPRQQAGRPVQRLRRRGQRALLQRPGTGDRQQPASAGIRSGLARELGGDTRPRPRQLRVRRLNRGQGADREFGAPRWQHTHRQGVAREGVPEADLAALVDEQALPYTCLECLGHEVCGVAAGRIQQRPVHAAAKQRGGDEHVDLRWVEQLKAGVHRLGE
jgi:hypothetical protein